MLEVMIEELRYFLGLGTFIMFFGLIPGILIGARYHRYLYKDED